MASKKISIGRSNIVACIWDFDKTLSPDYTQQPLFDEYGLNLNDFWSETNFLPELYEKQGIKVSDENIWQNHFLSYIKSGLLHNVSNSKLREVGQYVKFFEGLPDFFMKIKNFVSENYSSHNILLEHYIVSGGIAEIIRGSKIAQYVDGIFACEFIETPIAPGFSKNRENFCAKNPEVFESSEISQVGSVVDNTYKTRCIFEINKGCNKDPKIKINSTVDALYRRIPIKNMIYIADGPSDIPAFAIVKNGGGLTYAVYNPQSDAEFEQNDKMLTDGRIDAYGPADYRDSSTTVKWIKMKLKILCEKICHSIDLEMDEVIGSPPMHIHPPAYGITDDFNDR